MYSKTYDVSVGPAGFLPPAAALMGVTLPNKGEALIEGVIIGEEEALMHTAQKLLAAETPVIFPGPLVLWNWADGVREKAKLITELASIIGAKIIPMPDYRPKYPKINPEVEINPNHPNLTIWHNKIDVCVFVGVHCHYANVALKIIRGGTSCYTVALCSEAGHEDAMVSIRDLDAGKIQKLIDIVNKMKKDTGR